jgi:8-oxo-dGTP pyrophosphatase MutT (NUDIX family)
MYLGEPEIRRLEARFGRPREAVLSYAILRGEFDFIRSTQRKGRAHDVTAFVLHDDRLAVIQKPSYPDGAWRVPSGGIGDGEPFEEGMAREVLEETGLSVRMSRYLYRVQVAFVAGDDRIDWTTHAVEAELIEPPPAILQPIDTGEIVAACFLDWPTLLGPVREKLVETESGGLTYRAHLHDLVYRCYSDRNG